MIRYRLWNKSGNEYKAHKNHCEQFLSNSFNWELFRLTQSYQPSKLEAIDDVEVWEGLKVFIEFSERFYPTLTDFDIRPAKDGQKLYYDASFGQTSSKNILGLFTVGSATRELIAINENERITYILNELDTIFNNQATPNYMKHIEQNWVDEPFINGAYVTDHWKLEDCW